MLHILKIVVELFTKQGSWRKINPRTSKGGFKWTPHRFFGPKILSFQAIKMKLSVPVV